MIIAKFNGRHDNLGDKLIFSCLCEELSKHNNVFTLGADGVPSSQGSLKLRQVLFKIAQERLKGSRSAFFYPPGARFIPKTPQKKTFADRLQDKAILFFLSLFQCSLHITGISISETFNAPHYKRYKTIGVRDNRSRTLLSSFRNDVRLCPDLAFLRPVKQPKEHIGRAVFSFRHETPDNNYDSSYRDILNSSINAIVTYFSENDIQASFFSNVIEDESYNRQLAANTLSSPPTTYREDRPYNLDYESFFKEDGIVVSNRLHVLLPAMSEGLLPVALVSKNHRKIIDLFETFGFQEHLVYAEQSQSEIKNQVHQLVLRREELQKVNYQKLRVLRVQASSYIQGILKAG